MADLKIRLSYLDSIRGIAACVVVLHHFYLASMNDASPIVYATAFSSVSNFLAYVFGKVLAGHAAVMIFFVLSGFVLTLSLSKSPMAYVPFVIKRFFRIYPAFFFVILVSYALHYFIGVRTGTGSLWLRQAVVNPDLSFLRLIKHLIMWGTWDDIGLNSVIWSLIHEMRISLAFPFILRSIRRYGWRALLGYAIFFLLCTSYLFHATGAVAKAI